MDFGRQGLPERTAAGSPTLTVPQDGRIRRVLIVEDDDDNRNVYRLILEFGGYLVLEACTGLEGVERARRERPDLILMDVSIPEIDGWEATRLLKLDETTRPIPVIALTAHAHTVDRLRANEVGCSDFLAKPVAPSRVLEVVQTHLRRR
jgi:CheY-like chemotaxis protein